MTLDACVHSEFTQRDLVDNKIYTLPQRMAYRLGLGFLMKSKEKKYLETYSNKRVAAVDTGAKLSLSLMLGFTVDLATGLSGMQMFWSRVYNGSMTIATASSYFWVQEKVSDVFRVKKESHWLHKYTADLVTGTIMEPTLYMVGIMLSSKLAGKEIDYNQVAEGGKNVMCIVPLIAPGFRIYTNMVRGLFGIPPTTQRAYGKGNQ